MLNLNQGQEFLCYVILGIIISFIYDIFRSSRYIFKPKDIITYIEDIIYVIISAIIIIYGIIYISSGSLRLYILLGIIFGIVIYSLTMSKLCVIILSNVFKVLKLLINFIWERHRWKIFLNQEFIS